MEIIDKQLEEAIIKVAIFWSEQIQKPNINLKVIILIL